MTPFLFVQDGRCLTLKLCEVADGKFSWVLLAADCGESGFGAHSVIAHSAELTWAPEVKMAAMAALLLNHQQGGRQPRATVSACDSCSTHTFKDAWLSSVRERARNCRVVCRRLRTVRAGTRTFSTASLQIRTGRERVSH